ncbi:MAG: helix-turn-helix transcriptional regulator [Erysipelotrichaceae bacterium]|nr:helix-turn-helix transcriptional regulator [Erysipelotrichaceae bacterium]MBR3693112.1 helix-turn-helix transcriptional regulator [Erysipelotrichales bacterium]
MKFEEKLVMLRKKNGLSQEELADRLGVSRQAISRWELGSTIPDATNLLHLSELFHVSIDYLLHDEYESDQDIPIVKEVKTKISDKYGKQNRHNLIKSIMWGIGGVCMLLSAILANHIGFMLCAFLYLVCSLGYCYTYWQNKKM